MKPLHLNLASRPWQNTRPFWILIGVTAAVIAILLVYNIQTAWRYYVETEETRAAISEIQMRVTSERQAGAQLQRQIEALDRRDLMQRVEFVNRQIMERSFSWSQLLDHLERVLPNDVKLATLRPTIAKDGPILLAMNCIAKNQDAYVDTIRQLTADPNFENPYPLAESSSGSEIRFTLEVTYRPDPQGVVNR